LIPPKGAKEPPAPVFVNTPPNQPIFSIDVECVATLQAFLSAPSPFDAKLPGCLAAVASPVRVALAAAARPSLLPHVAFAALSALLGWPELQRALEMARGSKFVPELAFHPLPDAMPMREFIIKVCTAKTPLVRRCCCAEFG
jgi:hypothetical protein